MAPKTERALADIAAEEVRALLEANLCPICGRGPFGRVLTHVVQRHGVSSRELKLHARVSLGDGFCTPAVRTAAREAWDPERSDNRENLVRNQAKAQAASIARAQSAPTVKQGEEYGRRARRRRVVDRLLATATLDEIESFARRREN